MPEFNETLIRDETSTGFKARDFSSEKRETGGFTTDSKTDFVEETDSLEKHIRLEINAKHPNYNKFILNLEKLLDDAKKEHGLILFRSGI